MAVTLEELSEKIDKVILAGLLENSAMSIVLEEVKRLKLRVEELERSRVDER